MGSKKGRGSGPVDRQGGIAKAKEAAKRGASERAAERSAAERGESADRPDAEEIRARERRDGA